jgi:hypothetical protein
MLRSRPKVAGFPDETSLVFLTQAYWRQRYGPYGESGLPPALGSDLAAYCCVRQPSERRCYGWWNYGWRRAAATDGQVNGHYEI